MRKCNWLQIDAIDYGSCRTISASITVHGCAIRFTSAYAPTNPTATKSRSSIISFYRALKKAAAPTTKKMKSIVVGDFDTAN